MAITTDLIKWLDLEQMVKMQDSFHEMTGMSAVTTDAEGYPITKVSGNNIYCSHFTCQNEFCCSLCRSLCKYGARETQALGYGTFYTCQMGLVEFSVPLIIENQVVALLVGGMVFEKPPVEEEIRAYARTYHFDEEGLWKAARRIPVVSITQLDKASQFLYSIATFLEDSAKGRIQMEKAGKEIERTSQMKTDFLANMSHEIRTPMNAVIGMAEVALGEDMTPAAKEYVSQIQTSGKSLLHIINDILDYSKITSGKMDIFMEEYSPAIIIRDVTAIISNRLKDKPSVALLMDIDPAIPEKLIGDGPRIQQILINIANNAVKFTEKGYVKVEIRSRKTDDTHTRLIMKIRDTGIGIREGDLKKLFHSFTQVDSKRNRNVEGTGLGLAITQQLVTLMNGSVSVESVYGEGSTFTVEIPQEISVSDRMVNIKNPAWYSAACCFSNEDLAGNFQNSYELLGVSSEILPNDEKRMEVFQRWADAKKNAERYLFLDEKMAANGLLEQFPLKEPQYADIRVYIVLDAFSTNATWKDDSSVSTIKAPLYVLNLAPIMDKNLITEGVEDTDTQLRKFRAPEAKVLVVDDNKVSLRVAEKIFGLFGITIDKALSGKEALDMIELTRYDIIFMDHMMPELDGIDTTRLIRRFHPKFNSIPIIALTANAVDEARKLFLSEGMNDFVAKPIEKKSLSEKLKKWLPPGRIIYVEDDAEDVTQPALKK